MATIYSQTNCYYTSSLGTSADVERCNMDFYINFVKFLSQLETQGKVNRIAYFTGSGGLGSGTDYWDTANRSGYNSFGVWRFLTSSTRNYEWYLYLHCTSISQSSVIVPTNANPTTVINTFPLYQNSEMPSRQGVYYQVAICYSGALSYNPWNGTTGSFLVDAKSNPVWSTGSNPNANLVIFPRDNDKYGATSVSRDLVGTLIRWNKVFPFVNKIFSHFFYDENNLLICAENRGNNQYISGTYNFINYIGEFTPTNAVSYSLSSSMLPNGKGFCAFQSSGPDGMQNQIDQPNNTIAIGSNNGYHVASGFNQGGVFIDSTFGTMTCRIEADIGTTNTIIGENQFLKTNNLWSFEERPLYVYTYDIAWPRSAAGILGIVNTPLLRYTYGMDNHSVANQRAVLGASYARNTYKITVPWTGSLMHNMLQSLYAYYPVNSETTSSTFMGVPIYGNAMGPISTSLTMSVSGNSTYVRYDGTLGQPNAPYTTGLNYTLTQSSIFVSGGTSVAIDGLGIIRFIPTNGGWAQTSSLNFDFSGNKPFSFNAWYQRKDGTSNAEFLTYRSHVSGYDFMLFHSGVNVCAALAPKYTFSNPSIVQYIGGTSITFSSWGNLGFTYDGTQFDNTVNDYNRVKLYYNGQPVSTSMSIQNLTGSALSGGIGNVVLGPGLMSGCLAHPSFWSKALSDAEMLEIYNNRSNLIPPGPGLMFATSRSGSFTVMNNYNL